METMSNKLDMLRQLANPADWLKPVIQLQMLGYKIAPTNMWDDLRRLLRRNLTKDGTEACELIAPHERWCGFNVATHYGGSGPITRWQEQLTGTFNPTGVKNGSIWVIPVSELCVDTRLRKDQLVRLLYRGTEQEFRAAVIEADKLLSKFIRDRAITTLKYANLISDAQKTSIVDAAIAHIKSKFIFSDDELADIRAKLSIDVEYKLLSFKVRGDSNNE